MLVFQYSLDMDLSRARVPAAGAGQRTDGLWKHTCFEAFVGTADPHSYHEFNFSPSSDWAAYRFQKYRQGMEPAALEQPPTISVSGGGDGGLALEAALNLDGLPELRDARHLRIALAAVIEGEDGRLSYWAVRHPPGKPDFHHTLGFALEIARS